MTPQTLRALKESIGHWKEIAASDSPQDMPIGAVKCPLCQVFNSYAIDRSSSRKEACAGCPVMERTGRQFCVNTPFIDFECGVGGDLNVLAQAEVDFLESLLP